MLGTQQLLLSKICHTGTAQPWSGAHCCVTWVMFQMSDEEEEEEPAVVDIEETVPDASKNVELDKTRYQYETGSGACKNVELDKTRYQYETGSGASKNVELDETRYRYERGSVAGNSVKLDETRSVYICRINGYCFVFNQKAK